MPVKRQASAGQEKYLVRRMFERGFHHDLIPKVIGIGSQEEYLKFANGLGTRSAVARYCELFFGRGR